MGTRAQKASWASQGTENQQWAKKMGGLSSASPPPSSPCLRQMSLVLGKPIHSSGLTCFPERQEQRREGKVSLVKKKKKKREEKRINRETEERNSDI